MDTALARLASQRTNFHYTHQNIAELWNAMTRPLARNGLGLTIAEAERQVRAIEAGMTLLPDGEAVYREWRKIVVHTGSWAFRSTMQGWQPSCTFITSATSSH